MRTPWAWVILGDYLGIEEGDEVRTTGRVAEVPVGPELLGRVVNALGEAVDGKGPIIASGRDVIEKVAPGVGAAPRTWTPRCRRASRPSTP